MTKLKEMKKELENIKKESIEINSKLSKLKENELVRQYIELNSKSIDLKINFKRLSLDYEKEKLTSCNHIFITGYISREWDGHRTDVYKYPYCVKCGLDAKYLECNSWERDFLTPLQQEMINIYKNNHEGIYWDYYCEPNIATELYKKIKKAFPKLSDEELLEHFKVAVKNYENKKDNYQKVKK